MYALIEVIPVIIVRISIASLRFLNTVITFCMVVVPIETISLTYCNRGQLDGH